MQWLTLTLSLLFSFKSFALYEIIPYHSKIAFTIDYMKISTVEARFNVVKGIVDWDPKKNLLKKVSVIIKTNSIDSGDPKRDNHLRREDFFFVNNYPEATFESLIVKKIDNHHFVISGPLTLRGIKKNIVLNVIYKGNAKDHVGKVSEFFTAQTNLNRQDFKMVWNKALDTGGFLVGDEVQFNAQIQLQLANDKTAFSTHMMASNPILDQQQKINPTKIIPTEIPNLFQKPIDKPHTIIPWWKFILGFVLFCAFAIASYFIKLKLMKGSDANYNENSTKSILLDFVTIIINVGYAVWLYYFLYN